MKLYQPVFTVYNQIESKNLAKNTLLNPSLL